MASPTRTIAEEMIQRALRMQDSQAAARLAALGTDAEGAAVRQYLGDLGAHETVLGSMRRLRQGDDPTMYPTALWDELPGATVPAVASEPNLSRLSTPEDALEVVDRRALSRAMPPELNIFGGNVRTFNQALADARRQLPGIENLSPEDQVALGAAMERGAILKALPRGDGSPSPRVLRYQSGNSMGLGDVADDVEVTPSVAMDMIGSESAAARAGVPRMRGTTEIPGPYASEAELFGDDVARVRDQVLADQRIAPSVTRDEARWNDMTAGPVESGFPGEGSDALAAMDKSNRRHMYAKSDRVLNTGLRNQSPFAPVTRQRILDGEQAVIDRAMSDELDMELAKQIALRAAAAGAAVGATQLIPTGGDSGTATERPIDLSSTETLGDLTDDTPISMDSLSMPDAPMAVDPGIDIPAMEAPAISVGDLQLQDLVGETRPAPTVAVESPKQKPMTAQEAYALFTREANDQEATLRQYASSLTPAVRQQMQRQVRHLRSLAAEARSAL